mmetsp:Transcript_40250/g.89375  ORF Transcript_40250/g.89375 Transcript_40250/m.89375 type:complete len:227 (-) Transcript_40250:885-1565(-)
MGGKCTTEPVHKVSPMANAPGLVRPITSPAKPSITVLRSFANMRCGAASVTTRPVRATLTFMPFSNFPDTTRTNATLSLCLGSMFACSLKTKPVNWDCVGATSGPERVGATPGRAARSMNWRKNSSTPKLVIALAKNMGVTLPASTSSISSSSPSTSSSSTSSCSCSSRSGSISSFSSGSWRSYSFLVAPFERPDEPFRSYSTTLAVGRWYTPQKRSPDPIGQLMG